ncbi:MAG: PAS domain S-box protein [Xanthomonadales bacterium]|nr:PAS domain S-box protein [Xanthomonadales bacterium]
MDQRRPVDPVYLACTLLLALTAVAFFAVRPFVDGGRLSMRPLSAVLALLVALGLLFRVRPGMRAAVITIGAVVTALCGMQLARFIIAGSIVDAAEGSIPISQSFAAGLFCIGGALVIDGVLPPHWGRHLVFGLLGAIAAGVGLLGLFVFGGVFVDAAPGQGFGMRLPSALVLLWGGTALMAGARLRAGPVADIVTGSREPAQLRDRTGLAAGLAMLLLTLGATALAWREVRNQLEARAMADAVAGLERFEAILAAGALDAVGLLDGLRGLFAASHAVDAEEWKSYLDSIHLRERFVGVIAVAYVREAAYDATDPAPPVGGGAARPGDRFPIVHVAPGGPLTSSLIGMDVGADPGYRATLLAARARGQGTLSQPIAFARYADPNARRGFAVVMPVPGGGGPAGFVYAAVDARAVVEHALRDAGIDSFDVAVFDREDDAEPLFAAAGFDAKRPSSITSIDVGGRQWEVRAQRRAAAAAETSRVPNLVLLGGSIGALLLFALTWVLAGHRARAMHLAASMTAELRRSQRAQLAITDTANAGIVTADGDGTILYMNPAAAASFAIDASAAVGRPLSILIPARHRRAHLAAIARAREAGPAGIAAQPVELLAVRGDGTEFPIELLLSVWENDGQLYFTAFVRDITERRRQQSMLEQKTRELERSNADLEQFAYVASHDLQEPLRMVASYVQLLARRYRGRLDADADEFIGFAVDGATRMQQLIQDLLAYARLGRAGRESIATHLGRCAWIAVSQLQESIVESDASVHVDADCEVMAVPSLMTQLFQNLIANALKFRDRDPPRIDIDAVREGPMWHVRVRDNGIGIDPQHRERVFAIFQRLHTRREYPGTGIGLAICRRIVEGLGGRIWVDSATGHGCIFHFTVPAIEEVE